MEVEYSYKQNGTLIACRDLSQVGRSHRHPIHYPLLYGWLPAATAVPGATGPVTLVLTAAP